MEMAVPGPLHHLKRDNYENCRMLHPSGELMFRCLAKKIDWYVSRNLAKIVGKDPLTAQFIFLPRGKGHANDRFFLKEKENKCVVCNNSEKLTRHHIVPHCYIKFFPLELRRNNSYDVMILCVQHHHNYEQFAKELKAKLAEKHAAPMHGIGGGINVDLYHAHAFIKTLLKYHTTIPVWRKQEMLQHISTTLDVEISLEDLNKVSISKKDYVVKAHKHHGEIVLENIANLDEFVIMWRNHFVETMKPTYLPEYWEQDRCIYAEMDRNRRLNATSR